MLENFEFPDIFKEVLFLTFRKIHRKIPVSGVSSLKESSTHVFYCESCKILKTILFIAQLQATTSELNVFKIFSLESKKVHTRFFL